MKAKIAVGKISRVCSLMFRFFNRGGLKAQWSTQPRAAPWVNE